MKKHISSGLMIACLFFFVQGLAPRAQASTIFINEIHYDNTGTDTGEAIEIAGPAGTDLSSWSLLLYNGANGLLYDTTRLSGVIPDQDNGYGTLSFGYPTNGIQNGSPDGIALVRVSEFLSYEGTFSAVNNLASGLTSMDIGVSEGSSTAVGDSLQLSGTGNLSSDFTWGGPQANTFGSVNTGQIFQGLQITPEIFINEIHYDNTGTDTGEAIEIAGPAGTDLTTWSFLLYSGADGLLYDTTRLSGVIPDQDNGYGTLSFGYPTNGIQNGAPDGIALLEVVQFLSYEGSFTALNGVAGGLTSMDIGVSEGSSTAVGDSLQLSGTGNLSSDFTWGGPQANTFGGINTNQSFVATQPIPEPSTFLLLGGGLIGLAFAVRRRKG